jgi:hypothetical protein
LKKHTKSALRFATKQNIKAKIMNVGTIKEIGGKVLTIVIGVLIANEVQKQLDKRRVTATDN